MSSEAIIKEIRRETEERIKAIRDETEEKRKSIIKEAQKEAEAVYSAGMKEGLREIREAEREFISLARLEANVILRKTKEKGIAECFLEAERRLSDLSTSENYPSVLAGLIREAKEASGDCDLTVLARKEDRELVEVLIGEFNGISLSEDGIQNPGVVVYSEKLNVRIDQTLHERLKRMKKKLTHDTAVILYGSIRP